MCVVGSRSQLKRDPLGGTLTDMPPLVAWIASGLAFAMFLVAVIAPTLSNERLRAQLTGVNPLLTLGIALNLAAQALRLEDGPPHKYWFPALTIAGLISVIIGAAQMRRERTGPK